MATATVAEKELATLFDTMENWKEGQAQLLQQQLKMIKGIQEDQAQLLQQQQAQAARISEMEAELDKLRMSVHGELGKCVTTDEVTAMLDAKTHEVSIPVGSR